MDFVNTLPYLSNPIEEFSDYKFVSWEEIIYPKFKGGTKEKEIKFLYNKGYSLRDLSEKYHLTPQGIRYFMNKKSIKIRRKGTNTNKSKKKISNENKRKETIAEDQASYDEKIIRAQKAITSEVRSERAKNANYSTAARREAGRLGKERMGKEARKEADYEVDDRIKVSISGIDDVLSTFKDYIHNETLSTVVESIIDADLEKDIEIENLKIKLTIKK